MRHGRRLRIFRLPFNQTVEQLSGYEHVANADDFIRLTYIDNIKSREENSNECYRSSR